MRYLLYGSRKSTAFWNVTQDGLVEGTNVSQCVISMCRAPVLTCLEDGCTILTTCYNVRSHSCSMGKVYTQIGVYTSSRTKSVMKYTRILVADLRCPSKVIPFHQVMGPVLVPLLEAVVALTFWDQDQVQDSQWLFLNFRDVQQMQSHKRDITVDQTRGLWKVGDQSSDFQRPETAC